MKLFLEHKTTIPPAKSSSNEPTATTESNTVTPSALNKDQLRRLKRQLDLESELSSDADEGEDLGIEQVGFS